MFYDQWKNKRKSVKEKGGGERLVSLQGYLPIEKQILMMTVAGERLADARMLVYDTDMYPGVDTDELPVDPTRSKDYDIADASMAKNDIKSKFERSREIVKEIRRKRNVAMERSKEKSVEKVDKESEKDLPLE